MKNECFLEFWDNLWYFMTIPFFLLSPFHTDRNQGPGRALTCHLQRPVGTVPSLYNF